MCVYFTGVNVCTPTCVYIHVVHMFTFRVRNFILKASSQEVYRGSGSKLRTKGQEFLRREKLLKMRKESPVERRNMKSGS